MQKTKLLFLLALLLMAVTLGAWAQTPDVKEFTVPESWNGDENAVTVTYTATWDEADEEAANWTISPDAVAEGGTLTATYSGTRHVKSVKYVQKAAAPVATALSPALENGATIEISFTYKMIMNATTTFTFTNNNGTYSCTATGGTKTLFTPSLTINGNMLEFRVNSSQTGSNLSIDFNTTDDTYTFVTKGSYYQSHTVSVNGTDITSQLTEKN